YRLLVKRSIEKAEPFGIVLIKSGPEVGGPAEPHRVGTTAKVMGSTPLPGGRSFIIARGERRFEIESIDAEREPYLIARVRYLAGGDGGGADGLAARAAGPFGQTLHGSIPAAHHSTTDCAHAVITDGAAP